MAQDYFAIYWVGILLVQEGHTRNIEFQLYIIIFQQEKHFIKNQLRNMKCLIKEV